MKAFICASSRHRRYALSFNLQGGVFGKSISRRFLRRLAHRTTAHLESHIINIAAPIRATQAGLIYFQCYMLLCE
jgi:hypothetical protein